MIPILAHLATSSTSRLPRPWQAVWRAGLVRRASGRWALTDAGREALATLDVVALAEAAAEGRRAVEAWPVEVNRG